MLKTIDRPKRCPWCSSNLVAEIIHEINSLTPAVEQDLNDRRAVLGVNLKGQVNPKWQCMDCGAQIYGRDKDVCSGGRPLALSSRPARPGPHDVKPVRKLH